MLALLRVNMLTAGTNLGHQSHSQHGIRGLPSNLLDAIALGATALEMVLFDYTSARLVAYSLWSARSIPQQHHLRQSLLHYDGHHLFHGYLYTKRICTTINRKLPVPLSSEMKEDVQKQRL